MRAEKIFREHGRKLSLWATFNPADKSNTYVSADAQKFAKATNGANNTEVAGSTDPTNSAQEQAPQINPADIAKKALGTIFKGF